MALSQSVTSGRPRSSIVQETCLAQLAAAPGTRTSMAAPSSVSSSFGVGQDGGGGHTRTSSTPASASVQ
eukprot:13739867-Alexandrium_andersonii.AAC.1